MSRFRFRSSRSACASFCSACTRHSADVNIASPGPLGRRLHSEWPGVSLVKTEHLAGRSAELSVAPISASSARCAIKLARPVGAARRWRLPVAAPEVERLLTIGLIVPFVVAASRDQASRALEGVPEHRLVRDGLSARWTGQDFRTIRGRRRCWKPYVATGASAKPPH
jgi:hypothetical protein